MPFENLYFYDDSIISTDPFQEGNLIHFQGQGKTRVVEAPGDLDCPRVSRSIRAQHSVYTKLRD